MRSGVHWPALIISGWPSGKGPASIFIAVSDISIRPGTVLHHRSIRALPFGSTVRSGIRFPGRIGAASSKRS
jgi:hypothetical protein